MPTYNYSFRNYGDGGPHEPACKMVKYVTDETKDPPQWEEILSGDEKKDAIEIVNIDRAIDEPDGHYKQSTINSEQRWYQRTSLRTGNSWEVVLDPYGEVLPDPCGAPVSKAEAMYKVKDGNMVISLTPEGVYMSLTVKIVPNP